MFTFGILTTHLPYAALVLFYSFVIITGFTHKPSGTELTSNDLQSSGIVISCSSSISGDYTFSPETEGQTVNSETESNTAHYLPEEWHYFALNDELPVERLARNSCFSRPPPSL